MTTLNGSRTLRIEDEPFLREGDATSTPCGAGILQAGFVRSPMLMHSSAEFPKNAP